MTGIMRVHDHHERAMERERDHDDDDDANDDGAVALLFNAKVMIANYY